MTDEGGRPAHGTESGAPAGEVERRAVRVTIFGEDYHIRTEVGEDYTRRCARHVDDAIQEAHIGGHVAEPHRAAILAALKITDELFRVRERNEALERALANRLSELARRVEEALGDEEASPAAVES